MIPHDTWHLIEIIIRRYPETKLKYEQYISNIMASSQPPAAGTGISGDYSRPQSETEAKALKMTSAYADRLKREIEAVESTYKELRPEEQKVMKARFWSRKGKNVPYTEIEGIGYSERQMKRIVRRIILRVGTYIGEV